MPVAIVADSTAYLPPERIERHSITVVPLYVVFGSDRTEREDLITDYPAYFEELRGAEALPGTSQPSVGDFVAAYEPLLEQGYDIASVHISEGLSGTGQSGRQAAEQLARDGKGGERVRILDSRTAAGGTGLMVLAAAKAAEDGGDLDAVEANMEAARADFKMWFAVDTLEFLRRGGRIGAANAWIGSTLKIKPILTVESEMVPVERVRTAQALVRADGRLRAPAARVRRRRLGGPAHLGARPGRGADRALPRDVRVRPDLRQRGRPGAVHAHRAGHARRGLGPARPGSRLAPPRGRPGAPAQSGACSPASPCPGWSSGPS